MTVLHDLLPANEPTERATLSAALIDRDAALVVAGLDPDTVFTPAHIAVTEAIRELVAAGHDVDAVVVAEQVAAGTSPTATAKDSCMPLELGFALTHPLDEAQP